MQTAKTIPDQTSEIGLGIGNNDIYRNNYSRSLNSPITFPEVYYRRGLSNTTDLGIKLAFIGGSIDLKHNIIKNSTESFYASSGGILDYYILDEASFASLSIPIYFSVHPSEIFSFYFASRAGMSNVRNFFEASLIFNYAATGGLMFGGKTISIYAEVTAGNTSGYDFIPNQQITGGIKFRIPNKE